MQVAVEALVPPPGWDEFYAGCGRVHPYQSAAFGEWERRRGNRAAYLSILEAGEKVGQCLVSIDPRGMATWYFGPVLKDAAAGGLECATEAVIEYLKRQGVIAIENALTPACYGGPPEASAGLHGSLRATPVIDLTQPEEALHQSFDRAVRKNLRKCRERGAEFCLSEGDSLALDSYVGILAEHRKKLGFAMPPFYPNIESAGCFAGRAARLLVALARVDGRAVAGLGLAVFGRVAVEAGVAQSRDYAALKLPLHDFIKVEACRELARLGAEIYDLGGVALGPCSPKEQNIRRFKQKFSSRLASYHSISVRFEPLRYYYVRGLAKAQRLCEKVSCF